MPLETIRRINVPEADRMEVQDRVIKDVLADPEKFLKAYREIPESQGGRYICADLMKETFPEFNASKEHRGRYNAVVHNVAAVLTAEQYRRAVHDTSDPTRDRVLFITGMPGAGKSSTIRAAAMTGNGLQPDVRVIYEGQMVDAKPAIEKVDAALNAGAKVQVLAVLPRPEQAVEFTFRRFEEEGRGAGRLVMARIQEGTVDGPPGTPGGLQALQDHYRGKIAIAVNDVRDRTQPRLYEGSDGIKVWREELANGPVLPRIDAEAERRERAGLASVNALHQFRGDAGRLPIPHERFADGVRGAGGGAVQEDVPGRGLSEEGRRTEPGAQPLDPATPPPGTLATRAGTDADRHAARVFRDRETPPEEGMKAHPELAGGYQTLAAMAIRVRADSLTPEAQDLVLGQQRERLARAMARGQFAFDTAALERENASEHAREFPEARIEEGERQHSHDLKPGLRHTPLKTEQDDDIDR